LSPPPGNNGARIVGSMLGRFGAGEPCVISSGIAADWGSAIQPCMVARSTANTAIVTVKTMRNIQRKMAWSARSASQA
jgi:hypothetical protein